MRSKKQVARRNNLECDETLCLFPVESVDEQVEALDPGASLLDYMTWTIASYAIENRFTPPFRLLFTDAKHTSFRESILRMEQEKLSEEIKFEVSERFEFPLRCELTDMEGRKHGMVVSTEEMQSWMDAASRSGSRHVRFPAKITNFAANFYSTVHKMLVASFAEGLEPPFTAEIRDADGGLVDAVGIYADGDGEFRGGTITSEFAHTKFPITIRLISQNGRELATTVQRNQQS